MYHHLELINDGGAISKYNVTGGVKYSTDLGNEDKAVKEKLFNQHFYLQHKSVNVFIIARATVLMLYFKKYQGGDCSVFSSI